MNEFGQALHVYELGRCGRHGLAVELKLKKPLPYHNGMDGMLLFEAKLNGAGRGGIFTCFANWRTSLT